jgi:DNA-binding NarL/FixJ family response regulator
MKIMVVDDHPLVRDALRTSLRALGTDAEIVEARTGAEALEQAAQTPDMDLVLLDLNLPDAHGFSVLDTLRERCPAVPVVVLSSNEGRDTVMEAIERGAMGYIPKTSATEIMLGALQLVLAGGVYLPPNILAKHLPDTVAPAATTWPVGSASNASVHTPADIGLTERQAQILTLLVQGKSNKLIAREFGLSGSTIKAHISAIMKALHVANRTQAVVAVGRLGLRLDQTTGVPETRRASFKTD